MPSTTEEDRAARGEPGGDLDAAGELSANCSSALEGRGAVMAAAFSFQVALHAGVGQVSTGCSPPPR